MLFRLFCIFVSAFFLSLSCAQGNDEIDAKRDAQIERWSSVGFGDVNVIMSEVKEVLENDSSSIDQLKLAAERANASVNYLGFILEGYREFSRNVGGTAELNFMKYRMNNNRYFDLSNQLIQVRNECYLRIGFLLKEEGRDLEAFMYFRDAYRLSVFDSGGKGMRYRAEQQMKSLLGLTGIESFVTGKSRR